ncbi:MAG: PH domain-containing protein [Sporichthyaceae bacterium]|nr:PH domain-containing protein [Sporichthyaceae bacterium]
MPSVLSAESRVGAVNKLLAPSERVVIEVRRHWAQQFWAGVLVFGSLILTMLIDTVMPLVPLVRDVLWIAWFAVLVYWLWRLVEWSMDWFVITDRRFMLANGVLNRQVGMMPLSKVTDMRYERTLLGRVLGYGKFVLESAGQDQALSTIDYLPEPDDLYVQVCELLFGEKDST